MIKGMIIIIIVVIYRNKKTKYSINTLVDNYDLSDINIENEYLDYLKEYIYQKLYKINLI